MTIGTFLISYEFFSQYEKGDWHFWNTFRRPTKKGIGTERVNERAT